MHLMRQRVSLALWLSFLVVAISHVQFFDIYRGSAFNVVPLDDYAPYLLFLLGEDGGELPGSPFRYRLFSVALAAPLYYVLPVYHFSNLPETDTAYLRALEALSGISYLAILATSGLTFSLVRQRLGGTPSQAVIAMLGSFLLFRFPIMYDVNPVAIMFITLLLFCLQNKTAFASFVVLSAGVNEKIALLFVFLLGSRWALGRGPLGAQFLSSILALLLYVLVVVLHRAPGNESQLNPATYIPSLLANLSDTLSVKGLVLNGLPIVLMLFMYCLALREHINAISVSNTLRCPYFSSVDVVPMLLMVLCAHALNVRYNVGRLALYCFPLYLPLAAMSVVRLIEIQTKVGAAKQQE